MAARARRGSPYRAVRSAFVIVALLLLGEAPPVAAQPTPVDTLLLVYGEEPGGHLVPGLYLAAPPSSTVRRIEAGPMHDVAASADGARWAVARGERVAITADPGGRPDLVYFLRGERVSWLPDGSAAIVLGSLDGVSRGVWRAGVDGSLVLLLDDADGFILDAYAIGNGSILVVRDATPSEVATESFSTTAVYETVRIVSAFVVEPVRPFAIPRALVAPNGLAFVAHTANGAALEPFDGSPSRLLDANASHVPVAYAGGWLVWQAPGAWGVTDAAGKATAIEEQLAAAPSVLIAEVSPDASRLVAFVEYGATPRWQLVHASLLATPSLDGFAPHPARNLRALAWGRVAVPPTVAPTPPPMP